MSVAFQPHIIRGDSNVPLRMMTIGWILGMVAIVVVGPVTGRFQAIAGITLVAWGLMGATLYASRTIRMLVGMAAGAVVNADETVHAGVQRLFRVQAIGHVMEHRHAGRMRLLDDPVGLAERGDQERDTFLQRDVQPGVNALEVPARAALDDQVDADRPVGKRANVAQAVTKITPRETMGDE